MPAMPSRPCHNPGLDTGRYCVVVKGFREMLNLSVVVDLVVTPINRRRVTSADAQIGKDFLQTLPTKLWFLQYRPFERGDYNSGLEIVGSLIENNVLKRPHLMGGQQRYRKSDMQNRAGSQ